MCEREGCVCERRMCVRERERERETETERERERCLGYSREPRLCVPGAQNRDGVCPRLQASAAYFSFSPYPRGYGKRLKVNCVGAGAGPFKRGGERERERERERVGPDRSWAYAGGAAPQTRGRMQGLGSDYPRKNIDSEMTRIVSTRKRLGYDSDSNDSEMNRIVTTRRRLG